MKILTASEMKAADEATSSAYGIPQRVLIESAGRAVAACALDALPHAGARVLVVAGPGNNGADGFVTARVLHNLRVPVTVLALLRPPEQLHGQAENGQAGTGDAGNCAAAYTAAGGELLFPDGNWQEALINLRPRVIIDALFGSGFRAPATGAAAEIIKFINERLYRPTVTVIAVDIPSGLNADLPELFAPAVKATDTIAFQALRPAHVHYPASAQCGNVYLADVGISDALVSGAGKAELLTAAAVQPMLRALRGTGARSHKGTRGHVALYTGSSGKFGAAKLSSEAALRAGAGLASILTDPASAEALAPELKEVMCEALPPRAAGHHLCESLATKDSIVLGPGLGISPDGKELMVSFLEAARECSLPMIIDADGLNMLAELSGSAEGLAAFRGKLPSEVILTPHPGEMARLLRLSVAAVEADRPAAARKLAGALGATVVLKGARTVISSPEGHVKINPTASSALATAGSGDVLAGVCGAYLARGLSAFDAAAAAVFVHGVAGERVGCEMSVGALAGDILRAIPGALDHVLRAPESRPGLTRLALRAGS